MIYLQDPDATLYNGDCLEVLRTLPDRSVHMCATSPPFYGLRDYGTGTWEGGDEGCDHDAAPTAEHQANRVRAERYTDEGRSTGQHGGWEGRAFRGDGGKTCRKCGARRTDRQIGLEESPDEWVARLVEVFREVRRVLRDDATCWIEIGDSFGAGKQLLGQPWLLAFALQRDGWILRSEIIWARPNPMPESVTDRPTKAHSTVFLLSKMPRYYFDQEAIREVSIGREVFGNSGPKVPQNGDRNDGLRQDMTPNAGANARSVWTIPTEPTPFAHFATWPQKLCQRMILAGTSERGVCPECGAPWVRETTDGHSILTGKGWHDHSDDATRGQGQVKKGQAAWDTYVPSQTVGWRPSCACMEAGVQGRVGVTPEPVNGDDLGAERGSERGIRPGSELGTAPSSTVPAVVLDPFGGSGTTALVARKLGRKAILIELNEDYCELAAGRLAQQSLFAGVV